MIFHYLETGPLMVNCYILGDPATGEALVVDPGGDAPRILALLAEKKLALKRILITHAHFDHVGANADLVKATGAVIYVHPAEKALLPAMAKMAEAFGMRQDPSPPAGGDLNDGETVQLGKISLKVLHTPGHSPGGVCFYQADAKRVIVGDTLFQFSVGRSDFPGADHQTLITSIREKLLPLGDEVQVFPGHGPPTTIGRERKFNPFLNE